MRTDEPAELQRSLPRAAYWDPQFFAREQRSIFWNQWMLAGRAEATPLAGDYRVVDLAGESVVIVRDEDGTLGAHRNFCRHRGSRLLCGEGNARGAIRCPYHAWAYALDGTLAAAPHLERNAIPAESRALHRVALDTWGGFVFLNASGESAPPTPLLEQLAGVPGRLSRYPLAELRVGASRTYEVAANWKVILENYNECYHCAVVHPELCRIVPAFKQGGGASLDWDAGIPHRDGAFTFTFSGTTSRAPFPGLDEAERTRHKGELIYPNFMLSLSAEHVASFTLWPHAPDRTTIVCDLLFHPDEMARDSFDPSDAMDFWDLVNRQDWTICEGVQAGMRSEAFHFGYYAPMEDYSLDIRRYVASRLGADAIETEGA